MIDERLERLSHRPELGRADVVDGRALMSRGAQTRVGEIGGMHELVVVVAVTQHEDGRAVGDKLEEHGHDAETAMAQNRSRPDDRHVEAAARRLTTQELSLELGSAIRLEWPARRELCDRVSLRDAEDGAR